MLKFTIVLALCIATGLSKPANIDSSEYGVTEGEVKTNCTCGLSNKSTQRIVGGEISGVNEWPMMVALIAKFFNGQHNTFYCGATLITHRHIITAGHCMHDYDGNPWKLDELFFLLGAHNLKKIDYTKPNVLRTAEKFILHPKYKFPVVYDLAIIVTPYIEFNKIVSPACLPNAPFDPTNQKLTVVGWGYVKPEGPMPTDILKKTTLNGISYESCWKFYKDVEGAPLVKDHPYHLCTYQKGTSQCPGDSGGPLLWRDPKTNRFVLQGAVSFVAQGCYKYPQASSLIYFYLPWIQQVISETHSEEKTCARLS